MDDSAAREHFLTGQSLYDEARYEEALPEFEAAWELSHRPEMLFNIANAAERSFDYERAATALEQYMHQGTDVDTEVLQRRIDRNRAAAAARESADERGVPPALAGGGSSLRLAGWLTIGGAGALGVASLITGLVSHGTHSDLVEVCQPTCPADSASDIDSGRSLARASTALSGIALAAAIVGVVLVIVGRDDDGDGDVDAESTSVEVMPGFGGASVRVRY